MNFLLPSLLDVVFVEKVQPPTLQIPALVQIASQEGSKQRNEISIVVLKALRQPTPFRVESSRCNEQRIVLGLELCIKHHSIHDIVQHQLQTLSNNYPLGLKLLVTP